MTDIDPTLTPQEEHLIKCVAKGVPWEPPYGLCVSGVLDDDNPEHASQWHESRTIRTEVIRCLALGEIWPTQKEPWPVHAKGIQIHHSRIIGTLDFEEANLGHSLYFEKCHIDEIPNFIQAQTKHLSFQGTHLPGINACGVKVIGDVSLDDDFTANGLVDFDGAAIKGQFSCKNGRFKKEEKTALSVNSAIIEGCVFLDDGFTADGLVDFVGAEIHGQLSCENGRFHNAESVALNANSITVDSDVFLREGFTAEGEINFLGAIIGSHFQCHGGIFSNPKGCALNLRFAEIGSALRLNSCLEKEVNEERLWSAAKISGTLDMRQAKCRTYSDHKDAWPDQGKLLLDGFTYERFDEGPTDWEARKDWLMRQPDEHLGKASGSTFRPQPWVQASKVLMAMGHDADARNLALVREILRTHSDNIGWWRRLGRHILEYTIGHGYKPFRTLWWSLALCVIGWLTFAAAGNLGYMQRQNNDHVPPYNAIIYAFDAYLPVVDLGQDKAWFPVNIPHGSVRALAPDEGWPECTTRLLLGHNSYQSTQSPPTRSCGFAADTSLLSRPTSFGQWLFRHGIHRFLYWSLEIAGWVLISLFIAGISGLMKKE